MLSKSPWITVYYKLYKHENRLADDLRRHFQYESELFFKAKTDYNPLIYLSTKKMKSSTG